MSNLRNIDMSIFVRLDAEALVVVPMPLRRAFHMYAHDLRNAHEAKPQDKVAQKVARVNPALFYSLSTRLGERFAFSLARAIPSGLTWNQRMS